jgi:DNA-binding transcriptional MerR regulator
MPETYFRLEVAAELAGLTPTRVRRLQRAGLVQPARVVGRRPLFSAREVARMRRIRRLREHLGLNLTSLAIVLRLVEELEALRAARDADGT